MSGGESNLFGTLYEMLVFRDLVVSGSEPRLSVDRDQNDVSLSFVADASLLEVITQFTGNNPSITAQMGDADLGTICEQGLVIVQLKASLNPVANPINKGDLNQFLKAAVKHVETIRTKVGDSNVVAIAAFILVSNRPLGNISALPEQLKQLDLSQSPSVLTCPPCLGTTPSAKGTPSVASRAKQKRTASVTITKWCEGLKADDTSIASDLLLRMHFLPLSIAQCTTRFERQMLSLGLNSTELSQVGSQLVAKFLAEEHDTDSGIRELKLAIFETETVFHRFTPAELRKKEADDSRRVWAKCGFHRKSEEIRLHISSELTNGLIKTLLELAESESERKILVVSGRGGIGKSYQLLEAIGVLREQNYGILLPGHNWRPGTNCLDASGALFYDGYKQNWHDSQWIERLQRSLSNQNFTQPIILYFPNTDELEPMELEGLLSTLDRIRSELVIVLTARERVLNHFLKPHHREYIRDHAIESIPQSALIGWLNEQGVNTGMGGGLIVGGVSGLIPNNMRTPTTDPGNPNLERIRHPLFFASLARAIRGSDAQQRRDYLNGYLSGNSDVLKDFWGFVTKTVAERLHKHLATIEITEDSLRGAFDSVYSNRDQSPWTIESFNSLLTMVNQSDHKAVRNQMLHIGIVEEVDRTAGTFRWAFAEYDPEDAMRKTL